MPRNGTSRRRFLGWLGASAAFLLAPLDSWAAFQLPPTELEKWRATLFAAGLRRYYSDRHTDARLHLGGIGAGNFEIGADGQLTNWQLCNNLREGLVPFYFAVKAGEIAKLLQTAGGPDWPRIGQIEMTGQYPTATLQFKDPELPVTVELTAFSPFSPLKVDLSSTPVAVFRFRISNPTAQPQEVSLSAMLTNPIGYSSIGRIHGTQNPGLGWNINEPITDGGATGFFLHAAVGAPPSLDRPVIIYVLEDLFAAPPDPGSGNKNYAAVDPRSLEIPPLDRPDGLFVKVMDGASLPLDSVAPLIWLEDAPVAVSPAMFRAVRDAVRGGAVLVLSGERMPLITAFAIVTAGRPFAEATLRPDIVFDDFEGSYAKWKVEGEAFGSSPAHGTIGNQNPIGGFAGRGFVNSYGGNDDATGRMTSEPFIVDRHFIHFLVGGGSSRNTQIRLLVDGRVVRAASGKDKESLEPAIWDVRPLAGRTARLQIVDEQKGGWGHINVDQIVFSDLPATRDVMEILDELIPIQCGFDQGEVQASAVRPGTVQSTSADGSAQFSRAYGRGKVVLVAGKILDSAHSDATQVRQRAYALLCGLAGASYRTSDGQTSDALSFGSLALTTLARNVTALAGFEDPGLYWKQFSATGKLGDVTSQSAGPTLPGRTIQCALASSVSLAPGQTVEVPFLLAWHYPNRYSYEHENIGAYYATRWPDARAVMKSAVQNYSHWAAETDAFVRTFYDASLPYWLLEGLTANAAIARHIGVVFRIGNGDVYGWEGSNGSCPPTCTHVWGYEQAMAHLFPALEKEMRRIDFFHQQEEDGGIHNRTQVPSPPYPSGEMPFTDGHCSCILKAYREALNSPDDQFFRQYWPRVRRAVEYLIARDKAAGNGTAAGVLQDEQWNTYDEALHGVTTFLSGYYLAALRAGEEWARRMGETERAESYNVIYKKGQSRLVELCWNGEYFQQYLPDYKNRRGEFGPGCMSDQLLAQWWSHQLGLGYILPEAKVKSALRAIYKYNFKTDLTDWKQSPRRFAGAGDKGLIVCTWPKGGRPSNVLLYSDEVWTGLEYHVAAHLVYEGMIDEAFAIAKAARDRYDGIPRPPVLRNPWCEIECGGHYTRAMSSWSLLLAISGFRYDGPKKRLRFQPSYRERDFRSFFTSAEGWGSIAQTFDGRTQTIEVTVNSGRLPLVNLEAARLARGGGTVRAMAAHKPVPATILTDGNLCQIFFQDGVTINENESLQLSIS